ncbi:MAG: hypothetical protein ACREP7_11795 [Lysobacter sp.]
MNAPLSSLHRLAWVAVLSASVWATGCSKTPDADVHVSVINHIHLVGEQVQLQGDGGHRAEIGSDGALSIDGKAQTLTPAQQALSLRYYQHATGIARDGKAMGQAGAAMAGKAVGAR